MSNWLYKTIDEYMYKMHEIHKIHENRVNWILNCECGLEVPTVRTFDEKTQLIIIENLAIGNKDYLQSGAANYVAPFLRLMQYPFDLPIHPSLAAYTVALNYYHNIKICDAKTVAVALYEQKKTLEALLIGLLGKYPSNYQHQIRKWAIQGDLLKEILNVI